MVYSGGYLWLWGVWFCGVWRGWGRWWQALNKLKINILFLKKIYLNNNYNLFMPVTISNTYWIQ